MLRARLALLGIVTVLAGCGVDSPTPIASPSPSAAAAASAAAATPAPTLSAAPSSSPSRSAQPSVSPKPSATPATVKCTAKHGTVVDRAYASKAAGLTVRYRVYLPPCYATSGRRYPYVILLHGSDQDQTEWTNILHVNTVLDAGITAGTLAPMILVMPGGGDLANTAIFTAGKSYESVILDEIVPRVEKEYATLEKRAGREIGGISRGGFWAFSIAFRHPDLFAAVGGHSPFFWPTNAPPSSNPLDLANSVRFEANEQPRIWVDAGAQDYALPHITPFVDSLDERRIDHQFVLYPTGRHEIAYWRSHVKTYLEFYGKAWPKEVEDLPLRSR